MTIDSNYAFHQGPWIDRKSGVLLIIGWQKDIRTQKTRIEVYTLIPTAPSTLDPQPPVLLQAGLDPMPQISERKLFATSIVESKLREMIPAQCRVQYPDLFPYKFSEITKNNCETERLSCELMRYYEDASEEMRGLLRHEIEDKTRCEALRDCLRRLWEFRGHL